VKGWLGVKGQSLHLNYPIYFNACKWYTVDMSNNLNNLDDLKWTPLVRPTKFELQTAKVLNTFVEVLKSIDEPEEAILFIHNVLGHYINDNNLKPKNYD